MDTSFELSKESFKQIPHAEEHIAALQEMYKVVSASTPPPEKNRERQFLSFPSRDWKCFARRENVSDSIRI